MSGSNSSGPLGAMADDATPLAFTVHTMPSPVPDDVARRTARGRLKMLLLLLVCAAPVVASYLAYFVIRPDGRTNYSELISRLGRFRGFAAYRSRRRALRAETFEGPGLLVVVSGGALPMPSCERTCGSSAIPRSARPRQRPARQVWLIDDAATAARRDLNAVRSGGAHGYGAARPARSAGDMAGGVSGSRLESHMAIVDPMGDWMMRVPADPDPARLKRDVERLLRASSGWDRPGR